METVPGRFGPAIAAAGLQAIGDWWLHNAPDHEFGGFRGEIGASGQPVPGAPKGIVLNSRILWFFSAACLFEENPHYRQAADRAFYYLLEHFDDPVHGGALWELSEQGEIVNGKKQTYALCFCIYALSAYYRLTSDPPALDKCEEYFDLIETQARDCARGGYLEAFSRDWQALDDVRLGESDLNAAKTMNTHLHLIEAYTALFQTAPSARLGSALNDAVGIFCRYFVDEDKGYLRQFFDANWTLMPSTVSFGHDIEASWLLWEAAEALGDPGIRDRVRPLAERLADRCLAKGVGPDGQLCNGMDAASGHRSEASIWWVQAEALVGFLNAWRLTSEPRYRDAVDRVWSHIREHHLDTVNGEWYWFSSRDPCPEPPPYKAGFWKGPYHNGRAMLESLRRFGSEENH